MPCPNHSEWELYLDGELPLQRKGELEYHLAGCPACSGLLNRLRREEALLTAALSATPLPPDLAVTIKSRLSGTTHGGGGWLWYFLPALGLAGLFVAVMAGWWPLLERLRAITSLLGNGDLFLQLAFFTVKTLAGLAGTALRGGATLPALAVLVLCMLWMKITLQRGGRAHV